MTSTHDQLERDLRAALRSVDHVPVSADAWQQNQRRLATAPHRRLPWLVAAAAVVLAVLLIGGLLAVVTGGRDSSTPANDDDGSSDSSSSDEYFADENLLGPIVEVERLTVDGKPAVHEAVLSDTTGKGPSLCDRVTTVSQSSGSGGCTSREPSADDVAVAFDWLTGTMGSGDIRGVLAGVDERVLKVQIWMDNGDMTLADLKPGTWEGTKLFGLTMQPDSPRPQRLVAYSDASGTVLQAVDLTAVFGDDWLRAEPNCGARADAPTFTHLLGPNGNTENATVRFGYQSASVRVITDGGAIDSSHCVDLRQSGAMASSSVDGSVVLAIVAPEVDHVLIFDGDRDVAVADVTPQAVTRTPWQVVIADVDGLTADASLVAFDGGGNELAREVLRQPASP